MVSRPFYKKLPWLDYSGHLSLLKAPVFVALFVPGLLTFYWLETNQLGARPITETIHEFGLWGIRLLAITLAITPFRQVFAQPKIVLLRRMVGLAAFTYLVIHFCFYIVDEKYALGTVASEIVKRFYLTIGFCTLLLLTTLAVTSTDSMMRRLRRRWQSLHRLVYVAAILGTVHYFIQTKLNVFEPTWFAGVIGWLLIYRLMAHWLGVPRASSIWALALLSIAVGILTALGEYAYYAIFTGVRAGQVWHVNFTLRAGLRPGWIAMAIGIGVTILATLWKTLEKWRNHAPSGRIGAIQVRRGAGS
ncbi:MAG TPA: protein-methionine-sulfoxide reductase heme-binding subunit MsrQ [Stellaceae bacterium]|nr:protein-methionine-sulfoxide reductase heme-binding subunit MsrQ [Stellaceae bacterium]